MSSKQKTKYLIGIDEAGRGPLAGPVSVGVFCIRDDISSRRFFKKFFAGIRDSKKLREIERENWLLKFKELKKKNLASFSASLVSAKYIDKFGISSAIKLAMKRGLDRLKKEGVLVENCRVLLDGSLYAPQEYKNQKTIIKGDEKEPVISSASIVAKVTRDRYIVRLAKKYPKYGLEIHKGYGTSKHIALIKKYGLSDIHRRSFLRNIIK